jgi:hypothetical protein
MELRSLLSDDAHRRGFADELAGGCGVIGVGT